MTQQAVQAGAIEPDRAKQPMGERLQIVALNVVFWIVSGSRRRTLWLIRRTISHYGAAIVKCGWPWVRVKYVDLGEDDVGPFVFVANHRSFSDGFLMSQLPFECVQV